MVLWLRGLKRRFAKPLGGVSRPLGSNPNGTAIYYRENRMYLGRRLAVIGNRDYTNYRQLRDYLDRICERGDTLVSGGAIGADSLAQRYARERGLSILIIYPDYAHEGRGAAFARNKRIVENADRVLAFYSAGRYREGGTRNTVEWAIKLEKPYEEIEDTWSEIPNERVT